jgi:hypothetical protein
VPRNGVALCAVSAYRPRGPAAHPRCVDGGAPELARVVEAPRVHAPAAREAERVVPPGSDCRKLQPARARARHLRASRCAS